MIIKWLYLIEGTSEGFCSFGRKKILTLFTTDFVKKNVVLSSFFLQFGEQKVLLAHFNVLYIQQILPKMAHILLENEYCRKR